MRPYEYLYNIKNPLQKQQELVALEAHAAGLGVKKSDFRVFWKQYKALESKSNSIISAENGLTEFSGQAFELDTGEWHADDMGIWRYGPMGSVDIACPHPIMPVQKIRNIDTGGMKVQLLFRRGKKTPQWRNILVSLGVTTNAKEVLKLAEAGVSVTSGRRAQCLVDYLTDVMDRNYDAIPEEKGVARLGWSAEGFVPYVSGLIYDGGVAFQQTFDAVSEKKGTMEKWLAEAKDLRRQSTTGRIVLAASFASVLVEPLGILPFFVHLWSMASGTGKTVAQMVAAAVWGNPAVGQAFFPTFRGTSTSMEMKAGFLNSLPLFLDELQLAKDRRGNVIFNVYELASGTGKTRATKDLGLATVPTWANCFITSGETPIVQENDGAGAMNRVLEIECPPGISLVADGRKTANTVRENYGHAGRVFVDGLAKEGAMDRVKTTYDKVYAECLKRDTTEKQAMAAAAIITADTLATEWIFKDGLTLTVEGISEFLKTRVAVSASERGYDLLCDWVAQNGNKLRGSAENNEVYGEIGEGDDVGWVYIIRTVFNKVCADNGISPKALLSQLKADGRIQTRGRAYTRCKRINGVQAECIMMRLPTLFEETLDDELPF